MISPQPRDPVPLVVDGVSKRFKKLTAVDGVDLRVEPGEIFALLGPNGAGKSTLINCIAGLARPTAGRISLFGYDNRTEYRAARRLLGLVPQEISFDPFFTPHEALMIQMGLMGVQPDARWADELLETFALADHRNAYTRHLSGGMKRRLLVAKALVHRPRLLFLDEPTAGVDVELRKELWREVARLRAAGTTVVLTTHYLEEAEELADRVGIIHRGKILVVERTGELMRRHRRSRISFELAADSPTLGDVLPAGTVREGNRIVCPWGSPAELQEILSQVTQRARVTDVAVSQTTLEDVFLQLISSADEVPR